MSQYYEFCSYDALSECKRIIDDKQELPADAAEAKEYCEKASFTEAVSCISDMICPSRQLRGMPTNADLLDWSEAAAGNLYLCSVLEEYLENGNCMSAAQTDAWKDCFRQLKERIGDQSVTCQDYQDFFFSCIYPVQKVVCLPLAAGIGIHYWVFRMEPLWSLTGSDCRMDDLRGVPGEPKRDDDYDGKHSGRNRTRHDGDNEGGTGSDTAGAASVFSTKSTLIVSCLMPFIISIIVSMLLRR